MKAVLNIEVIRVENSLAVEHLGQYFKRVDLPFFPRKGDCLDIGDVGEVLERGYETVVSSAFELKGQTVQVQLEPYMIFDNDNAADELDNDMKAHGWGWKL
jgi:hypothetical protein